MTTAVQPTSAAPGYARVGTAARLRELLAGRADQTTQARVAMVSVGLVAAVVYLWNLTISGYANVYYSAAALAGSQSWSAWFFGSIDASNFITVDKPPLAVMLMGLSVRLFGLSSASILLPEALLGVATVLLLFVIVRRQFGVAAATIAALVMALTPAAVLMFRYDNPDALLTFLLVAGAWATMRSLESGRARWLVLAAVFVGLGFNAKFLQAYLVLPAFVVTWLVAAPVSLRRRLVALIPMAIAGFVASFWWVGIVELIPAAQRPFVGGSTDGSPLQLLFGYDGLGRIFGQGGGGAVPAGVVPGGVVPGGVVPGGGAFAGAPGAGGPGGGPGGGGGGGFSGAPGLLRLFNAQFGDQVSWLIPLALVGLGTGVAVRFRAARTDVRRAAYLMWGGWFIVTAAVFSFMSGIIHSYYAVALAPAIGALVGAGVVDLWRRRSTSRVAAVVLAAGVLGTAVWAAVLLNRTPAFLPGLDVIVVMVALAAAVVIASPEARHFPRLSALAAAVGLAALLVGPSAYAISTMNTAFAGGDPAATLAAVGGGRAQGQGGFGDGAPGGGGPGGALSSATNSSLYDYLLANVGSAKWAVAVQGSEQAAEIELATGLPVMAMGGFSGSDPAPTLEQLQALVASGDLRYVVVGGGGTGGGGGPGGGGPGGGGSGRGGSSGVTAWVTANGTLVTSISGVSLYDLSGAATSGA